MNDDQASYILMMFVVCAVMMLWALVLLVLNIKHWIGL